MTPEHEAVERWCCTACRAMRCNDPQCTACPVEHRRCYASGRARAQQLVRSSGHECSRCGRPWTYMDCECQWDEDKYRPVNAADAAPATRQEA